MQKLFWLKLRAMLQVGPFIMVMACTSLDVAPVAEAPADPNCQTVASLVARLTAEVPTATIYADIKGRKAVEFMAAYNSTPPASDAKADRVTALLHPSGGSVFAVFSLNGCVVGAGPFTKREFDTYRGGGRSA